MFVSELSRLFRSHAEGSALEPIALKAATVMSVLLLQKPAPKAKSKELFSCLERCLNSWTERDINSLILEGRQLQNQLPQWKNHRKTTAEEGTARSFANLMFTGKSEAPLKLLSQKCRGRVLQATQLVDSTNLRSLTVLDSLKSKHPPAQPTISNALPPESPEPTQIHPVIFDSIDASTIQSSALATKGSAGPSGLDTHCWRRLCTSFKFASQDLWHSLALLSRKLCTTYVDPNSIYALLACRLITLDKCPGVRPIGVCETARRIISKAILTITKWDLQEIAGSAQLYTGQVAGIEAAIPAMRETFLDSDTVDASNAFNSLNRKAALLNIKHTSPTLATILINIYRNSSELLIDKLSRQKKELHRAIP